MANLLDLEIKNLETRYILKRAFNHENHDIVIYANAFDWDSTVIMGGPDGGIPGMIFLREMDPDYELALQMLIKYLDDLFDSGADLAMESVLSHFDDGGSGLYFFILKPEYLSDYSDFEDVCFSKYIMEIILKNPTHFIQIVAGPY